MENALPAWAKLRREIEEPNRHCPKHENIEEQRAAPRMLIMLPIVM
jgi:hypothetical protein